VTDEISLAERAAEFAAAVSGPSLLAICRVSLAELFELSWMSSSERSPSYLRSDALCASRSAKGQFLVHWGAAARSPLSAPPLKDQLTPMMRECVELDEAGIKALVASLRAAPAETSAPAESQPAKSLD
jgi:hypothetical protein